jgi:hypothetical protein
MKRHRLDPKKPRQLTPAEALRLDATPIDYSNIPPLGEEFFTFTPSRSTTAPKKNARTGGRLKPA